MSPGIIQDAKNDEKFFFISQYTGFTWVSTPHFPFHISTDWLQVDSLSWLSWPAL